MHSADEARGDDRLLGISDVNGNIDDSIAIYNDIHIQKYALPQEIENDPLSTYNKPSFTFSDLVVVSNLQFL